MTTILVIDDEPTVRAVVHDVLVDEGYTVITAANGADALERLKTVVVDLILCDQMMPVMPGEAFAQALRAEPRYQALPLILMSAVSTASIQSRSLYTAVVEKPWTIDGLLRAITAALGRSAGVTAPWSAAALMPDGLAPDGPVSAA
jgi:two-component system, OmpR family, response regulator VicR